MTTIRKFSIISLVFVLVAALAAAFSLLGGAFAADASREISLSGSNYFYTSNQAEINDYDAGNNTWYTSFVFADDDSTVTYRKNLAFNWYSSVKDSDGNATSVGEEGFLSTEIGFDSLTFESFQIKFQSQQYTQTGDGVTDNFVTFVADADADKVYAVIGEENGLSLADIQDVNANYESEGDEYYYPLSYDSITIRFTSYAAGVYTVEVTDGEYTQTGSFANVGGSYSRYVSSTSGTSVVPLTYSAKFAEGHTQAATMILYSFNGQSFALSGDSDNRTVTDDTPPVLCLGQGVTVLDYGSQIDLDYAVIDMLATSPRATLNYYVLENAQVNGGQDLSAADNGYFYSVSGSDVSPVIKNNDSYTDGITAGDGDYETMCLVKVYYTLRDSTATGGMSDNVYLEWYIDSEYLYTVESGGQSYSFIRAADDKAGATYATDENTTVADVRAAYQQAVDEALSAQNATAGDGNYFYLPSFEGYVTDNISTYRDMTFSVYYMSSESGSNTSLDYNELAIELEQEGTYTFAIYATDAAGNNMYYLDESGEPVTFEASELADLLSDPSSSDLVGYVPVFEFSVNYVGLSVEDPGAQSIGFVDTQYSASGFNITGLSSNYNTEYTLYLFDRQQYTEDNGPISYAEFLDIVADLFEDGATRARYFTTILASDDPNDISGTYSDYEWDPDNLTFVPQDDNAFYVIRLEARDVELKTDPIISYMSIGVSAAAEPMFGEDNWAEDNVASIVLLCIAGLAIIGIVLFIVIKPKDKGDIDVVDENESKKGAKKKIKKVNKK